MKLLSTGENPFLYSPSCYIESSSEESLGMESDSISRTPLHEDSITWWTPSRDFPSCDLVICHWVLCDMGSPCLSLRPQWWFVTQ